MMTISRILTLFLLLINSSMLIANPLNNPSPVDIQQANQTFDRINIQLSTQNLNSEALNTAISTLEEYTQQADQCMSEEQKKLNNLNALLPKNTALTDKTAVGADLEYLNREEKKATRRLSQCRLFSIRAKEAIEAYKTTLAKMTQQETLARNPPLWGMINQLVESLQNESTIIQPEIEIPTELKVPWIWGALLGCAMILAGLAYLKIRAIRSRYHLRINQLHLGHALLLALCFSAGALFVYMQITRPSNENTDIFITLFQQTFTYLFSITCITLLFKIKRIRTLLQECFIDTDASEVILLFCFSAYYLGLLNHTIIALLKPNELIIQLDHCLFLASILLAGVYFLYYACRIHHLIHLIERYQPILLRIGTLFLLVCLVLTVSGFCALAMRLTISGFISCLVISLALLMLSGINKLYLMINHASVLQIRLIRYFGYKSGQTFIEFLILKITLQVVIIAIGLYLILGSWGFASYSLENAYGQLIDGFHFANTMIYPARVILGLFTYCIVFLIFRYLSTIINRHQQFENEEETQVAVASILIYLGFAVAMVCSLLVAGFNFTGLAIITGALSVGVGLGLQSIVNNFVSGLILLIEKPIKAGDRINIDGTEGFVKKIRVRSTHIITPAHEDVIVPNSDLITRRVTNYVYTNKQFFITCEICIPHGSDANRIREILLEAANEHEEIIKTGRNKPCVLFSSYGEKTLIFKLCCLIRDVNKKFIVQSDLNFAIDALLRKNNLGITS